MTNDPQSSDPKDAGNGEAAAASEAKDGGGAQPENETEALRAERDKLREQLLRVAADLDNFRKRTKRDLDDARQRGRDDLVRELLPVFDNLERAVQSGSSASDVNSVIEGVRMVLKMFEDTSERIGLSRVKTVGERFDPAQHEALQQVESGEHAPGAIVAEIAAGYRFGERLVRPAMVVVARKPREKQAEAKSDDDPASSVSQAGGAGADAAKTNDTPETDKAE